MDHTIRLPAPTKPSPGSLQAALHSRRSSRDFSSRALPLAHLAQLLWAGQGITSLDGHRTTPSAGGLHPLSLHVVAGNVQDVPAAVYRYMPNGHLLSTTAPGDRRADLSSAALGQEWIASSAAVVVIAAAYERTTDKYGERGVRYAHMEAGAAAQNIALQAADLGLACVVVGAFDDDRVAHLLALPDSDFPLSLMPVGLSSNFLR